MLELARELQSRFDNIFEHTILTEIKKNKSGVRLTSREGSTIHAKRVVYATGGYFSRLEPKALVSRLFDLNTSIAVSRPLNGKFNKLISDKIAIHDDRRAGNYFRLLPDDRLLWGRDIRSVGIPNKKSIIEGSKADLVKIFPTSIRIIEDMSFEYAWSGKLAYTNNLMPVIKSNGSDFFLTGFGGHGMNTAPAAAQVIAEAILGDNTKLNAFLDIDSFWNGGIAGKYFLECYLRWLKFCDFINQ